MNRTEKFSYRVYAIVFLLLVCGLLILLFGARAHEWQPWICTIAASIATVLCAGAGLMQPKAPGRWLLVIAGGLFTGWVT